MLVPGLSQQPTFTLHMLSLITLIVYSCLIMYSCGVYFSRVLL